MRTIRALSYAVAALAFCCSLGAQELELSLAQYINQLERLQTEVAAAQPSAQQIDTALAELPATWTVRDGSQTFSVSSVALQENLGAYQRDSKKEENSLADARRLIALLLVDAKGMDAASIDAHSERQRLDQILARKEFYGALHQNWWERLKREAQLLVFQLLERMVGSSAFPVVGRIFVWGMAALAFCLLAWWVVRNYLRSGEFTHFSGQPEAISAEPWRDWQAEAQAAAEQGRWRDAVHFAYWTAISFLEGQGLWRPDRARTPREYLRLLPRADVHRESLAELTREFEQVWYGRGAASESQFLWVNAILGRLGCR
jgi:Domain of unknown function (DUF4129)